MTIAYGFYKTAAGDTLLACHGRRLCYLGYAVNGNRNVPLKKMKAHFPLAAFVEKADSALAKKVAAAWNGKEALSLELHGTPFQIEVWNALLDLGRGSTASYQDVARRIGKPNASRAVGSAVGANPVSLLVPCHRVLPASGGVGNYAWGAAVKQKLLDLESISAAC